MFLFRHGLRRSKSVQVLGFRTQICSSQGGYILLDVTRTPTYVDQRLFGLFRVLGHDLN